MRERLNVPVEEYTTMNPVSIAPDMPATEVFQTMQDQGCRHMLVMQGADLQGIISDRDIYKALANQGGNPVGYESLRASHLMTAEVFCCSKSDNLDQVVFTMSDRKIGSAVVKDKNDEIFGIFTSTDALNALVEVVRGEVEA